MAKGKAKTLAMNHKSSRVLQSILKYGTVKQKTTLVEEAIPSLVRCCRRSSPLLCASLWLAPSFQPLPTSAAGDARALTASRPRCAQVELAKDTYGTHLARKIVDYAGKPELPNLLKAVKARTRRLPRAAGRPHPPPSCSSQALR